jgi:hypothetical protein
MAAGLDVDALARVAGVAALAALAAAIVLTNTVKNTITCT